MRNESAFGSWIRAMGLRGRKGAAAAKMLGMTERQVGDRVRETVEASRAERLALTAAYFGLPEWDPAWARMDRDDLLPARRAARKLREALAELQVSAPELAPRSGDQPEGSAHQS